MPRKIEVSKDQVQKCIELYQNGQSFTKIGNELNIARRIVAKLIKKQAESARLEQVAAARRDIAGMYFRNHIQDIEKAVNYLLQLVAPPSLRNSLSEIVPSLDEEILSKLKNRYIADKGYSLLVDSKKTETAAEWGQPDYQYALDVRALERKARETLEGLKKHMPSLWPKVREWQKAAELYNEALQKHLPELRNLCAEIGIRQQLVDPAIQQALNSMSEQVSDNQDTDIWTPRSRRLETPSEAAEYLQQTPRTRQKLRILTSHWYKLGEIFEEIESLCSPNQLHKALVTNQCRFCPVP